MAANLQMRETVRVYCPDIKNTGINDFKHQLYFAIRDAREKAEKTGNSPAIAFLPGEVALQYFHNYTESAFKRQVELMQKKLPPDIPAVVGMNAFVRDGLRLMNLSCIFTRDNARFLPKRLHPSPDAYVVGEFHAEVYSRFRKNRSKVFTASVFGGLKAIRGAIDSHKQTPFPSLKLEGESVSQRFEVRVCADIGAQPVIARPKTILLVPADNLDWSYAKRFDDIYKAIIINDSHNGVKYFLSDTQSTAAEMNYFLGLWTVSVYEAGKKII